MDLSRQRDVSTLFGDTVTLFLRHAALFTTVTVLVVAPFTILIDGIWAEGLTEGPDADAPFAATLGSTVINGFLVPPLVTALHVTLVQRLAAGETPGVGDALAAVAARLGPVLGAWLLYSLAVGVGLLLLVVPGVWLGVRLYFAVQAAVVEGRGPVAALRRSAQIVDGRWWPTFGRLLLAAVVFSLLAIPFGIVIAFVDSGVVYIVLSVLANTLILSLTALLGTLLFFELAHGR